MLLWLAPCLIVTLSGGPSGAAGADIVGGATELKHRLAAIASERREIELRTQERGRAYVRMVRLGLLPMSGGFDGLVRHAQQVQILDRLLTQDLARAESLRQQSVALKVVLADLKKHPADSLAQMGSYSRSKEAILAAKEREAAFERAFRSDWKPANYTTVYSSVAAPAAASSFVALQGKLAFPVGGRAQVKEVPANSEFGPGLNFKVDASSTPRSVFRGKVVLVADYGSLGQAVVLDHGQGYNTLSANLKRVDVEAGQQLNAGAALGQIRGEGDTRELYFELRHNGNPVSASEWFGL